MPDKPSYVTSHERIKAELKKAEDIMSKVSGMLKEEIIDAKLRAAKGEPGMEVMESAVFKDLLIKAYRIGFFAGNTSPIHNDTDPLPMHDDRFITFLTKLRVIEAQFADS